MELFTFLAETLRQDVTATIAITMTANGKMTVCTNFTMRDGSLDGELQPFVLKGTPAELDEGFLAAIEEPMETIDGLVNNLKEFKDAALKAKTELEKKTEKDKAKANSKTKEDEERKKREEEEKKKKEEAEAKIRMGTKAMEDGEKCMQEDAYHSAKALFEFACEILSDKKAKAEAQKKASVAEKECGGMLCNDSPEDAEKALNEFKKSFELASNDAVEEKN